MKLCRYITDLMDESKSSASSPNSNRHPPNLRGKAIGLWYAQRQRSANSGSAPSRARAPHPQPVATIELSPNEIQRVTEARHLFKDHRPNIAESSANIDENPTTIDDAEHAVQFDKLHSSFQYFEPLNDKPEVNEYLLDDLRTKQSTPLYQNLNAKRSRLPISKYREEILQMIEQNQIFVLIGETGSGEFEHKITLTTVFAPLSGKTTQTAQFILDNQILKNRGSQCRIICSQPRRISGKQWFSSLFLYSTLNSFSDFCC